MQQPHKSLIQAVAELNQKAKIPVQYIVANVGVSLHIGGHISMPGAFVNRVVESRL